MNTCRRHAIEALVSFLVLGLWIYVQLVLLAHPIPGDNRDLVLRMLGVLDAGVFTVLTYWLGSSVGSARKTDMLGGGSSPTPDGSPPAVERAP